MVRQADFLLLHGNGVRNPERIAALVRETRRLPGYRPMPILFNEDDHFDFEKPMNNLLAAVAEYASWGFFDPGQSNYQDGYQSPPVNSMHYPHFSSSTTATIWLNPASVGNLATAPSRPARHRTGAPEIRPVAQ